MGKVKILSFLLFILLFPCACLAYKQEVLLSGFWTNNLSYDSGSVISIKTTLVNVENYPHSNLSVLYELSRAADGALVYSDSGYVDLGSREVKPVTKAIQVPQKILSGEYILSAKVLGPSGVPISAISSELSIRSLSEQGVIFEKGGFYLSVPVTQRLSEEVTQTYFKTMYGLIGEAIESGTTLSVHFSIRNKGSSLLPVSARVYLIPSYRSGNMSVFGTMADLQKDLGEIMPENAKSGSFEVKLTEPGTYSLILVLYSGEDVLSWKEVRAVVSGESGKILEIRNSKDVYRQNEEVKLDVLLVGPADKSQVEGAYLEAGFYSSGQLVKSLRKDNIALNTDPGLVSFSFRAPQALEYYDVRLRLGRQEKIFDEVNLSYHPMEIGTVLAPDGRFMPVNISGCYDDGICTENEKGFGNCLDCVPIEKTKKQVEGDVYSFYLKIALLILIIALAIIFLVKRAGK